MNTYYFSLFAVFAVIIFLMVLDPNIATYIDLQFRNLIVQLKRQYYLLTIGIQIKYENWKLMRSLKKMRKELNLPNETNS